MSFKILNLQQFPHKILCVVKNLSKIWWPVAHFCGRKDKQQKSSSSKPNEYKQLQKKRQNLQLNNRWKFQLFCIQIVGQHSFWGKSKLIWFSTYKHYNYSLTVTTEWFFKWHSFSFCDFSPSFSQKWVFIMVALWDNNIKVYTALTVHRNLNTCPKLTGTIFTSNEHTVNHMVS